MASEVGGEQRCGTGARLRGGRENQGLSLAQAAERLHLDASTLEAMEAEDFAALGADVYVRGHLRRYAELIGESPSELQELYARRAPAPRPDLTRIARRAPSQGAARLLMPWLLGLAGVALLGLLWWLLTTPGERAQPLAAAVLPATGAAATQASAGAADGVAPCRPGADAAGLATSRGSAGWRSRMRAGGACCRACTGQAVHRARSAARASARDPR